MFAFLGAQATAVVSIMLGEQWLEAVAGLPDPAHRRLVPGRRLRELLGVPLQGPHAGRTSGRPSSPGRSRSGSSCSGRCGASTASRPVSPSASASPGRSPCFWISKVSDVDAKRLFLNGLRMIIVFGIATRRLLRVDPRRAGRPAAPPPRHRIRRPARHARAGGGHLAALPRRRAAGHRRPSLPQPGANGSGRPAPDADAPDAELRMPRLRMPLLHRTHGRSRSTSRRPHRHPHPRPTPQNRRPERRRNETPHPIQTPPHVERPALQLGAAAPPAIARRPAGHPRRSPASAARNVHLLIAAAGSRQHRRPGAVRGVPRERSRPDHRHRARDRRLRRPRPA